MARETLPSKKQGKPKKEPYIPQDDGPALDPDLEKATRDGAKASTYISLDAKYKAETVFIRNAKTKQAHADKRRADAEAEFTAGPRSQQVLAEAEFTIGPRSDQARADAHLSRARASYTAGAETRKAHADADLAHARADFTLGAETKRALADAEHSFARAMFIAGAESERARAEAGFSQAREIYVRGVETQKTRAETVKTRAETVYQWVNSLERLSGMIAVIVVAILVVKWHVRF